MESIEAIHPFEQHNEGLLNNYPIYFFDVYSDLIQSYYNQKIVLIHHNKLNAFAPFKIRTAKYWKFAQLMHSPINDGNKLSYDDEKEFFNDCNSFLSKKLKIDKIEQGNVLGFTAYKPNNAAYCNYGTYQTNLINKNADSLLKQYDNKYARDIRHVEKQNVIFKTGPQQMNAFFEVYNLTAKHTGMYTDKLNYFKTANKILTEKHCTFSVAFDGNNPIGSLFSLHTPYKMCITHTGTNRNSKIHGAIRWLHHNNMLHAISNKTRYYDLMGVRINSKNKKLKGIFDFKKGFGGELLEGYLWKKILKPTHLLPYNAITNTKNLIQGNKFKDIIDQEN